MTATLEHTYAEAVPELSVPWTSADVPDPRLLLLNEPLAAELGLDPDQLRGRGGLDLLLGHAPGARTVAQAYAGHQFGMYSPRLGDGRALLLGELVDARGRRRDLHLKGSGRTPFARGGDGKAVIGPMLREYLIGEALHALGVPTTRALAVLTTGERVWREEGPLPGAVLCRVAASHLRVGTFQYAAASGDLGVLRDLATYAIDRHHPSARGGANRVLELYRRVVEVQADLIAQWMLVGFVHGVMNTDNMSISGESIDFGPCALMDRFDYATVFSSIDRGGRYAYGNQPAIAQWNLARLGETLIPLIDEDADRAADSASEVLADFGPRYSAAVEAGLSAKLGLDAPDRGLASEILELLAADRVDFTGFFRSLAAGTAGELFTDRPAFDDWAARREPLLPDDRGVAESMNRINPLYIPRNHRVEEALAAATAGELGPFLRLLDAVSRPFDARPGLDDLTGPAPADAGRYVTYCGT